MTGIDITKGIELLQEIEIGNIQLPQEKINKKNNLNRAFENLEKIQEIVKVRGKRGIDGPFPCLDFYTQGIIEGKVYTIGAFSNTGKSQLSYEYVSYFLKQGKKIVFISTEVGTGDLLGFISRNYYRQNYSDIISGKYKIKKEDFKNLYLYDCVHSFEGIKQVVEECEPDYVFIDFIQSINHKGATEYEKMTNLAIDVQALAIEKQITIFSLSQVNNESRHKDGTNITLKGSGGLFASSDIVFGLYRDNGQVKITITKNKFGPYNKIFDVEMNFDTGEIKMAKSLDTNEI